MFELMVPPGSKKEIEKWLSVEDITNAGLFKREKGKKMEQDRKRNLKQLREKLYIPMTQDDHFETFSAWVFKLFVTQMEMVIVSSRP